MLTTHVLRGAKAGLVAGLAFGLLVALVANPLVGVAEQLGHDDEAVASSSHDDEAVASSSHDDGAGSHDGHAAGLFSTAVTNGVSVVSGVLWGLLLGTVVFGALYYFLEPAIPGRGPTKDLVLAGAGFLTVSGAPWLVLPPQPPGVESALTADTRLLLYGGMLVLGATVCLLSGAVYNRVSATRGTVASVGAAVLPLGLLVVPAIVAPSASAGGTLPPDLAAGLRGLVVLGQVGLWMLLAGAHTWFHHRGSDTAVVDTRSEQRFPGD